MEEAAEVYRTSGLRGALSYSTMDQKNLPRSIRDTARSAIEKTDSLYDAYHGKDHLKIFYSLRALMSCSEELVQMASARAKGFPRLPTSPSAAAPPSSAIERMVFAGMIFVGGLIGMTGVAGFLLPMLYAGYLKMSVAESLALSFCAFFVSGVLGSWNYYKQKNLHHQKRHHQYRAPCAG